MTNVVFVNRFFYPDISATSQILSDLAFGLARDGVSVHVVCSRMLFDDAAAQLPASECIHGVQVHRVASTRFGRHTTRGRLIDYLSFYWFASWRMFCLLGQGDVLVAKTDPPILSVPALLVARLRRARLVNWLQDLFPEVAESAGVGLPWARVNRVCWSVLKRLRDFSLKHAHCNVVLGSRMAQYLTGRGISPEKLVQIPNWADIVDIQPVAAAENTLRSEWGLQNKFVVGYSGNMGVAHEFELLLAAAQALMPDQRICFLFIGDGRRKADVVQQAARRGLTNLRFEPFQPRDRLAYSLSAADLHVVSLRANMEGFIVPSKFCGISAAGRPTLFLGHHDGEIARLIEQADCGRAVSPDDLDGLVAAITWYASDHSRGELQGENARSLAETLFDRREAVARWHRLIQAWSALSAGGSISNLPKESRIR